MLKIDDRFKKWMRRRLQDKDYAERVLKVVMETNECELLNVWPHAALPGNIEGDPETMIGMLKGIDHRDGKEFIVGIFGEWKDFSDLMIEYVGCFWKMYDPITLRDFEKLPCIYEIAFESRESEEPIRQLRWNIESKDKDGCLFDTTEYDGMKVNLINTDLDSDVIRIITGG